uniref:Uncharacterized protein n=1 Tax=Candidozyma auris TaxID=498019 RepID=A0A0L0NNT4_CANAR
MNRCQSKVGKAMCPADFLSKEVAALSGRIFLRRRKKVLDPGMEVTKEKSTHMFWNHVKQWAAKETKIQSRCLEPLEVSSLRTCHRLW